MARTVKQEAVEARRKAILAATQRLVLTRGYEEVSLQDILREVNMSSGAFHHYFESREALLAAFIEEIKQESEKPLLPILHDEKLNAIEKFQGFFDTLNKMRTAQKELVVRLGRIWYSDANAVVRLRVDEAIHAQRAPLLTQIVQQGVQEGVFTTAYPQRAGEVIMQLLRGMGDAHSKLLFAPDLKGDDSSLSAEIITIHNMYMDTIERILGVPEHTFTRAQDEAVQFWHKALREERPEVHM